MARKTFFSFHYKPDAERAAQVRNMGMVDDNAPVSDNDWETITKGGDAAIKEWIDKQMKGRSCAVVLAGEGAAGRKWITHEIVTAWNKDMGVVVFYIHKLKDLNGKTSAKGRDPLEHVTDNGKKLSTICKAYNPAGSDSKEVYAWIKKHLAGAVEEAIEIREQY